MLSIGKLLQLAQLHETETSIDDVILDSFHDDLDFIGVQEKLADEFKSVATGRGKHSREAQIENIARVKASKLAQTPSKTAFLQIFKNLARDVLQGKALSIEDAADILTLKDNNDTVEDYATALHLLTSARNIPDERQQAAFRSVWRRVYIHDDWQSIRQTANISDTQLNARFQGTALYATLLAILSKEYQSEGHELSPSQAAVIPLLPMISSRWPGMPREEMESLSRDYQSEGSQLQDLELTDEYHKVRELVHDVM